eukprot:TRINITY_DN80_c1_g1_i1.p1 TRINITY_DN80_c1_g1~~TRINITY_DN80_c1_g1_i1.p1  ORF type:complete len:324 (-),score=92.39 TRINITY_DN80_c1_g1_i1:71-1042(-)
MMKVSESMTNIIYGCVMMMLIGLGKGEVGASSPYSSSSSSSLSSAWLKKEKFLEKTKAPRDPLPFDINNMYTNLMYSYAAYCDGPVIDNWTCFWCTYNASMTTSGFIPVSILYNTSDNIQGYVGYQGNIGYVVFRGTEAASLKNWITDLDAGHSTPYLPVPNAYVHTGFFRAWMVAKAATIDAILKVMAVADIKVWQFTGHSLGAALSELAAVDIILEDVINAPVIIYNFGAPRVGNEAFVQYYDQLIATTYRATNMNDIVPHLPDEFMGFRHPATEVWWNTTNTYKICDGSGEDPTCSDSRLNLSIEDHLDYLGIHKDIGGC